MKIPIAWRGKHLGHFDLDPDCDVAGAKCYFRVCGPLAMEGKFSLHHMDWDGKSLNIFGDESCPDKPMEICVLMLPNHPDNGSD